MPQCQIYQMDVPTSFVPMYRHNMIYIYIFLFKKRKIFFRNLGREAGLFLDLRTSPVFFIKGVILYWLQIYLNNCFIPATNLSLSMEAVTLGGVGGLEGKYTTMANRMAADQANSEM